MENVYTDAMIVEMKANGPFDNDKAIAFAEKHRLAVASVRAKAVRTEGIGYVRKPKTSKDGSPVESKADIVADIATVIGSSAERLESLGNATKDVLVLIRSALS